MHSYFRSKGRGLAAGVIMVIVSKRQGQRVEVYIPASL